MCGVVERGLIKPCCMMKSCLGMMVHAPLLCVLAVAACCEELQSMLVGGFASQELSPIVFSGSDACFCITDYVDVHFVFVR